MKPLLSEFLSPLNFPNSLNSSCTSSIVSQHLLLSVEIRYSLPRLQWGCFPCGGAACLTLNVLLTPALLCCAGWHPHSSLENLSMWPHMIFTCLVCLVVQSHRQSPWWVFEVLQGRWHGAECTCTMPWEVVWLCWDPLCSHSTGRPLRGWWPSVRTAAPPFPFSKWHMVSAVQGRAP